MNKEIAYTTLKPYIVFKGEYEEKKSKFYSFAKYVENENEITQYLNEIKKQYSKAKHICFAWRLLSNNQLFQKSTDDGEPTGTAGRPILNLIEKNNLYNIIIIVVRIFGGIKLGAGNLLRAYLNSAKMTVFENNLEFFKIEKNYKIIINIEKFLKISEFLTKNQIKYVFLDEKTIEINISEFNCNNLLDVYADIFDKSEYIETKNKIIFLEKK